VADHQHGCSLRGEEPDHRVEVGQHFVWKRTGRLVEDDHACSWRAILEGPTDSDGDSLTGQQACDSGVRVNVDAEEVERLLHRANVYSFADPSCERIYGVTPDPHVVDDGEIADEAEVLVNECQPVGMQSTFIYRRADAPAIDQNLATGIGTVHTTYQFHQCRLAGAVLADNRVDLAGRDLEVGAVEDGYPGKRL
jgi:hypothetical protein